jgi:peptidyl-prolyl cis-trans isomerase D
MKDHYVVVAVTDAREEGLQKASTARTFIEPVLRNKKKAEIIAKKVAGSATLEDAAGKMGAQVNRADSVRFAASFVPGVGAEPKLVGASFNKAFQGKLSTPIEGQAGVYFIRVEEIGATPTAVDAEQQRKALQAQQKQFAGYGALQALRTAATVEDERRKGGY